MKRESTLRAAARGFSLVELLVVLTILLVIAAIAIPNYLSAMQRAREAGAIAFLRQVQTAQETYRIANHEYADTFAKLRPYLATQAALPGFPTNNPSGSPLCPGDARPLAWNCAGAGSQRHAARSRRDTPWTGQNTSGPKWNASRSGRYAPQWRRHSRRHDIHRFDRAISLHLSADSSLGARVAMCRRTAARPDHREVLLQRQLECHPFHRGRHSERIEPSNLSLPRQAKDQLPAPNLFPCLAWDEGCGLSMRLFYPASHTP
jgi:prepilin-type N-terminal cleavage/methylation domain-containing protein